MKTRTEKIVTATMTSQILSNQLNELQGDKVFTQALKQHIKNATNALLKVENEYFDSFFNAQEQNTSGVYDVYDAFISEVAKVKIYDCENIMHIIKAYHKDQKSIEGIVNKILKK